MESGDGGLTIPAFMLGMIGGGRRGGNAVALGVDSVIELNCEVPSAEVGREVGGALGGGESGGGSFVGVILDVDDEASI